MTQKVKIALELDALGVDVIEAGFPIASEADFDGVKKLQKVLKRVQSVVLQGLEKKISMQSIELLSLQKISD